ncbi:Thaumatin-like protein [Hibiscus syriacus]|uniref:Thaumatin-like protein n=1 Tax=Hibiscus syriacus TaxID=106335 RepID=A0A6A2WX53_HIBSY|nr:Thaumatin-like protein [Hibiscus syriacus]
MINQSKTAYRVRIWQNQLRIRIQDVESIKYGFSKIWNLRSKSKSTGLTDNFESFGFEFRETDCGIGFGTVKNVRIGILGQSQRSFNARSKPVKVLVNSGQRRSTCQRSTGRVNGLGQQVGSGKRVGSGRVVTGQTGQMGYKTGQTGHFSFPTRSGGAWGRRARFQRIGNFDLFTSTCAAAAGEKGGHRWTRNGSRNTMVRELQFDDFRDDVIFSDAFYAAKPLQFHGSPWMVWSTLGSNTFDDSGLGKCITGDCGGMLKCTGGGAPPVTQVEFTIAGGGSSDKDFYDAVSSILTPTARPSCGSWKRLRCVQYARVLLHWRSCYASNLLAESILGDVQGCLPYRI